MHVDWNKPVEVIARTGVWSKAETVVVFKCDSNYAAVTWYDVDGTAECRVFGINSERLRNTPEPEQGRRYFIASGDNNNRIRIDDVKKICEKLDNGHWKLLPWYYESNRYPQENGGAWIETDANWNRLVKQEQKWRYFKHKAGSRYRVNQEGEVQFLSTAGWIKRDGDQNYSTRFFQSNEAYTETDANWKPLEPPKSEQPQFVTREQFESAMEKVAAHLKRIVDNTTPIL